MLNGLGGEAMAKCRLAPAQKQLLRGRKAIVEPLQMRMYRNGVNWEFSFPCIPCNPWLVILHG